MKYFPFSILAIFTIAFLMTSCEDNTSNNNSNDTYMLGDTISIAYEEIVNIETPDFQISLDSIHESRCPSDVICVWEGQATAFFTKITPNQTEVFSLTIMGLCNQNCGGMTTVGNHQVELLELNPYPEFSNPAAIEDYWAKIIVTTL